MASEVEVAELVALEAIWKIKIVVKKTFTICGNCEHKNKLTGGGGGGAAGATSNLL